MANGVDCAPPTAGEQIVGEQLSGQHQCGAHPEIQDLATEHDCVVAQGSEFSQRAHGAAAEPFGSWDVADASRSIGDRYPGLRHDEGDDRQGDGDHRQVVAAGTQGWHRDQETQEPGDCRRDKDRDPDRHPGARGQQRRGVRAEGKQCPVAQRDLALVADQYVQPDGGDGVVGNGLHRLLEEPIV